MADWGAAGEGAAQGAAAGTAVMPGWGTLAGGVIGGVGGLMGGGKGGKKPSSGAAKADVKAAFEAQLAYERKLASMSKKESNIKDFLQMQRRIGNKLEQGLMGGPGTLPPDVEKKLLADIRASQAARGMVESPAGAVQEAAALLGGSEAIRAQRFSQAQQYLQGWRMPTLGGGSDVAQLMLGRMGAIEGSDAAAGQGFGALMGTGFRAAGGILGEKDESGDYKYSTGERWGAGIGAAATGLLSYLNR